MAMGMMTEYYHFIFTTLVMYPRALAWLGWGSLRAKSAQWGHGLQLEEVQAGAAFLGL